MTASNTSGLWAGRKVGADKGGDSCGFGAGLNCRYVIEYSIAYTLVTVAERECPPTSDCNGTLFLSRRAESESALVYRELWKTCPFHIFIRSRGVIPAAM